MPRHLTNTRWLTLVEIYTAPETSPDLMLVKIAAVLPDLQMPTWMQEDLLAAVKDILQSIVSSCQDFGCQMLQQPIDDLFILVVPPGDVVPFTRIITKNLTRCFDYFYTPEQHKERLQVAVSGVQSSDKSTWDRAGLLAVLLQSNQ